MPMAVFDSIGKNATIHARMSIDSHTRSRPTQMITSGAIATTGVTCMVTA